MQADRFRLLRIHVLGYIFVLFHVLALSVACMWVLQGLAIAHDQHFEWAAILRQLFLTFAFLAFYPGQTFWTYRLEDPDGTVHTIIGRLPEHGAAED